ncbi:MAG: endonuclease/exonuclease/phosphatase family protein [Kofleriaceae bacterium]
MVCLITWNVLADAYVNPAYFPRVDPALLVPGVRTAPILASLAASPADVVCLQEIEPAVVEAIRATGGWDVHFASKIGRPDGCAILARRAARLSGVQTLAFADGAPDRVDSGHVALVATVHAADRTLQLATTHLRWDAAHTPHADRWATRQVRDLIALFGADPSRWIVCGDLNVQPGDPAYVMLTEAGLVDVMPDLPTANANDRAKRIDHILVGRRVAAIALPVMPITDTTPLPSDVMPSDHLPIGVTLAL